MLNEAIILAGGFGTRLKTVVSDVPKPMAPVNNYPFLVYLFRYLKHYQIKKIVLSVGHLSEIIESYFKNKYNGIEIKYAHELTPMGTGGGIRLALEQCDSENVLVLNGDTFFDLDIKEFYNFHKSKNISATLGLRVVDNSARYGTIEFNESKQITKFVEKTGVETSGVINAGVYLLNKKVLLSNTPITSFSIEKEFFEKKLNEIDMYAFVGDGYFIDIGIPEDYYKANEYFKAFTY